MKKHQISTLKNLIYLVLIVVLFTIGSILLSDLYTQARTRYIFNPFYATIISIVCFGGIGALLGLSNTNLSEFRKIPIDKSRLLLLTLPSFIVSMSHIWAYFRLLNFSTSIYPYILEHDYIIFVSSIILGFSAFTSFTKKQ